MRADIQSRPVFPSVTAILSHRITDLAGLHPGVKLEDVRKEVPWDLKVADRLENTRLPTEKELSIIRHFAPEISMGRKLQLETIIGRLLKLLGGK